MAVFFLFSCSAIVYFFPGASRRGGRRGFGNFQSQRTTREDSMDKARLRKSCSFFKRYLSLTFVSS